ncbi:malic enzyme [Lichtheimia corymbifera JMRC:FSU:9682]|uniref:Malic enzyme n=1 Tax=Lichtheimia corymbifera JMRC:FSU:9682 TaxID=1263082 RepID=A0A068RUX0_9FUNG|nr:malic enzyme [Lichtheimia corymbifera JMRC:FSU:9682]
MLRINRLSSTLSCVRTAARRHYGAPSAALATDPRNDKTIHLTQSRGVNVIHDPLLSKGTAFNLDERERLSIRGLVPPRQQEMDKQLLRVKRNLDACETPLAKFVFLSALQDRNETLFYKLVIEHLEELSGVIYTPTVGLASQRSHSIYRRSRGMYFSSQDRGAMSAMVYNWPHDEVDVIVVTDGSRVLGLGDLGANGMQIPIGKLSLYVAAGGIRPRAVLPVVLDVGTNNEELLNDPLYLGMPHRRLDGEEYYSFVDEWVTAVKSRWPNALIQFEDFKYPHAYNLLNKYRKEIRCFNDDIQSTSAITLAGILASLKARGKKQEDLSDERIICVGAGSAGVGVCEGIIDCMVAQGRVKSREDAYRRVYMLDQHGLLGNPDLPSENSTDAGAVGNRAPLDERQSCYVKSDLPDRLNLEQVVERVKPSVILGLTGIRGVFTEKAIRTMAQHHERPVVFPLSNPDTHAECSAEEAYRWTEGRAIFASGSPFKDVVLPNGKIGRTNQCNNSYSFPGLGLGVTVSRATHVTPNMFLETARAIADLATPEQLKEGILFPGVQQLRSVAHAVGTRVCEVAYEEGVATARLKEGELLEDVVKSSMYTPEYVPLVYHQHH